jgi:hypothetical protein
MKYTPEIIPAKNPQRTLYHSAPLAWSVSAVEPGYNAQAKNLLAWGKNMGLYSHYDRAHNHPVNRALHMIAIPIGFSSLIVVWWHWVIALLLVPTAFALAWLGHWIEGNQPAFLTNPVHVFVAPVWLAKRLFGKR